MNPALAQIRIIDLDKEISKLLERETTEGKQGEFDEQFESLFREKADLQRIVNRVENDSGIKSERKLETSNRIDELKHTSLLCDEKLIRQMIEYVHVISKEKIHITFRIGLEADATL